MSSEKILFIDTETGGLEVGKHSLLSIALVVWQDFDILDSTEILVNDGVLNVTEHALAINKINLDDHRQKSVPSEEATRLFIQFITRNFDTSNKITVAGHNVNFDINFLKNFFQKQHYDWNRQFSHRIVDTSTILYYLFIAGKLKKKAISSDEAFALFGIDVNERHSALGDATGTAKLFSKLLKVIGKNIRLKTPESQQPTLF